MDDPLCFAGKLPPYQLKNLMTFFGVVSPMSGKDLQAFLAELLRIISSMDRPL
jgi:hypothetical protein